jgi:hypothetical protein
MGKIAVKSMLKDSGNIDLFNEESYAIAKQLTFQVEKKDKKLRDFFKILEGTRDQYIHDLMVKNKKVILAQAAEKITTL